VRVLYSKDQVMAVTVDQEEEAVEGELMAPVVPVLGQVVTVVKVLMVFRVQLILAISQVELVARELYFLRLLT